MHRIDQLFVPTCKNQMVYYGQFLSRISQYAFNVVCHQNQHFISTVIVDMPTQSLNHHRHLSTHPSSILTSGIIPKSIWYRHRDNHRNARHHRSKMLQHHICNVSMTKQNRTTSTTTTAPTIIAALLFIDQQYITILQRASTILLGSDLSLIPLFL